MSLDVLDNLLSMLQALPVPQVVAAASSGASSAEAPMRLDEVPTTSTTHPPPANSEQQRSTPPQSNPNGNNPTIQTKNHTPLTHPAPNEPLFLLTCIPTSRYGTTLQHLDLHDPSLPILSDRHLLTQLRTHYQSTLSTIRHTLTFRTLTSLTFVQFELHRRSLVDIRKRDDIPPAHRADEYSYRPLPAELIPPVGRNHLMHIYHHPEDAEGEVVCMTRFPKRMRERLRLGGEEVEVPLGWGIEFVEGTDWRLVWCFGFAIVALSLVVGVVWAAVKRDVQAGFGIAAYMMTFCTFTVGMLQAAAVVR